ncbi:hypothetical protein LPB86_01865 [Pedobacter sp. MC2016-14]|uniref:hypothetical protein n=1 Tax=Pedobacter sp. MC2016-14 TaxID=2897327 RepID=UPI001E4159BD|nr:hypothetical protein [Pedobacter sp. MC2016-14]MCD0486956.1 hypothetical protein [Pedobacter sp. MC2016-14]
MDNFLIFSSLIVFTFCGYMVWPSRLNVVSHLTAGGSFISIFVPSIVVDVSRFYPKPVVDLYVNVLVVGMLSFLPLFILGFRAGRGYYTRFSFELMNEEQYEQRAIKITKYLMIGGVAGLIISYIGMGFIPVFAQDPISAKLFRGAYQEPYRRVAILFRSSFFILATIMPIACIIWYKYRYTFFLYLTVIAFSLMIMSLVRSSAFGGVALAVTIVMATKSRRHFALLMIGIVGMFICSAFFYHIVGARTLSGKEDFWQVVAASSPDIDDQLQFLVKFRDHPVYTYGKTIYGGLIPGHYKWNPSVYTLNVTAPTEDINNVSSGGIRLPLPLWGYVSFQWVGVVLFSGITAFLSGFSLRILKNWFEKFPSLLTRTICVVIFGTLFGFLVGFTSLNMYNIPPLLISLLYIYRFKWN